MKVKAFITHKLSEHYADCQDRFCIDIDNRTVAVSDGMSQSIFPEYWADLLSAQYAHYGHCTEEDRKELCVKWIEKVNGYLEEQVNIGKNPWRLKNNIASRLGAGATICGVHFENATNWKGNVLGDSCIVEVNTMDWTANILSSEDKAFDSHPDYYDSFPEKQGAGKIREFSGNIGPNNLLLLVSDPFSEYFDKHKECCQELVEQIQGLCKHNDFSILVDRWREKGMHNDDSTLCIIEFDNDINMNIVYKDDIQALISKEQVSITQEEAEKGFRNSIVIEPIIEPVSNNNLQSNETEGILFEDDKDKLETFFDKVINVLNNLIKGAVRLNMPRDRRSRKLVNNKYISQFSVQNAKEEIERLYHSITPQK